MLHFLVLMKKDKVLIMALLFFFNKGRWTLKPFFEHSFNLHDNQAFYICSSKFWLNIFSSQQIT